MPEQTPFHCAKCSCQKQFTSDCWRLKHIKLHHPEHLQVTHQKNQTIRRATKRVDPTQHCEFNTTKDSVKDLDTIRYNEHVEYVTFSESQPPSPPIPQTETYARPRLSAERWHSCDMETPRSWLPWDKPTSQSLLPVRDACRVQIYAVWDQEEGHEEALW